MSLTQPSSWHAAVAWRFFRAWNSPDLQYRGLSFKDMFYKFQRTYSVLSLEFLNFNSYLFLRAPNFKIVKLLYWSIVKCIIKYTFRCQTLMLTCYIYACGPNTLVLESFFNFITSFSKAFLQNNDNFIFHVFLLSVITCGKKRNSEASFTVMR